MARLLPSIHAAVAKRGGQTIPRHSPHFPPLPNSWVQLSGPIAEQPQPWFGGSGYSMPAICEALRKAAYDPRIRWVAAGQAGWPCDPACDPRIRWPAGRVAMWAGGWGAQVSETACCCSCPPCSHVVRKSEPLPLPCCHLKPLPLPCCHLKPEPLPFCAPSSQSPCPAVSPQARAPALLPPQARAPALLCPLKPEPLPLPPLPACSGVVLKIDPLQCGWGKIQELRRHLEFFRQSGGAGWGVGGWG